MNSRNLILQLIRKEDRISAAQIGEALGLTRQAINRHIIRLIEDGLVVREGRTRGAIYAPVQPGAKAQRTSIVTFLKTYRVAGLEEDQVFLEVSHMIGLERALSTEARRIAAYAFTEMLNNVIEHSESSECRVEVTLASRILDITIRDFGIGVFYSVSSKLGLGSEEEAIGVLLKGKGTTMPERHAGEGIFFTSKSCDHFSLRSHRMELSLGSRAEDSHVSVRRFLKGTEVSVIVRKSARRKLEKIFSAFAPEEYDFRFERTMVSVRLFPQEYLTRRQGAWCRGWKVFGRQYSISRVLNRLVRHSRMKSSVSFPGCIPA